MLNKKQRATIVSYISLLNPRIKQHLRDIQLLNNNGTLRISTKWDGGIERWWDTVLEYSNYEIENWDLNGEKWREAHFEISSCDTHSGNPVIFEFEADEFNLV